MKGRQRGRAPGPRGVAGVCTLTPGPDSLWTEIGVSVAAQLARPCTGRGRVFRSFDAVRTLLGSVFWAHFSVPDFCGALGGVGAACTILVVAITCIPRALLW